MPRRRRAGVVSSASCGAEASPGSVDEEGGCCARPEQRHAANARERARMRVLARAFCRLKTTLPWVPADTKLSKLDTLRLAASYIAHLRAILTDEPAPPSAQHPLNLTWPFSFQQPASSASAAASQPAVPAASSAPAPAAPPLPAGGGSAPGWPPAAPACRPHLPPSPCPSSSCSADGDGEGDADLDEDDCPLFHRQHQLHHHQHHQHHPHLQSHVAHLPYSDSLMHLG